MQVHPELQAAVLQSLRRLEAELDGEPQREDDLAEVRKLISAFDSNPTLEHLKRAWGICSAY